jgi:hypothetical protein
MKSLIVLKIEVLLEEIEAKRSGERKKSIQRVEV